MRTEVRHRLKEDPFAEGTREAFEWLGEHRNNLIGGVVVAAVIIGGYLAWYFHGQNSEQQASLQLAQAVRTMSATLSPQPLPDGTESYPTATTRAQAAEKKFAEVNGKFGSTPSGRMAGYYTGVARMQAGDSAGAERQLKNVAGLRDQDIAALGKLALASLYVSTGREAEAIPLCKELIDRPTATVSKDQARLQLAEAYAQKQPQEAMKLYQLLQTEDPTGPAAQIASAKLAEMTRR